MKRITGLLLACLILFSAGIAAGSEKVILLDDCRYASAEAARAQWKPTDKDFPPVEVTTIGGRPALKLPCNFSTNKRWGLVWEHSGEWDLSACQEIALDITADAGRPAMMMLNFKSGDTWYRYIWALHVPPGTNTLTLPRRHFPAHGGKPAGWNKITAVRIGVVREEAVDREILVSNIRGLLGKPRDPLAVALNRMGKVAGFGGVRELTTAIKANVLGQGEKRRKAVLEMLAKAENITREAGLAIKRGDADQAVKMLNQGQQAYIRAYAASVPSKPGEFRAVWCHSPKGVRGMSWDQSLKTLADAGFNAIIVNVCWGDRAAYKSKLLPMVGDKKRDLLAECVAAGKKHGIAVHAWKCNMRCRRSGSGKFYDDLLAAGRFQQDRKGKPHNYVLCPSAPENLKLEIDSMVEMARDYDVAGIHFDYIRYPGEVVCYCPRCRKRFEAAYKVKVKNWPADVLSGELKDKYLQFRRDQLTAIVAGVSRKARKVRPDVLISAAVYWHWPSARVMVGQDWKLWAEKGYLDFVCPMQYTLSASDFEGWTQRTSRWVGGRISLMPGIGSTLGRGNLTPDETLQQILITRKHKTAGFVLFEYRPPLPQEHLPLLRLGATAKKTTWTPPKPKAKQK